MERHLPQKSSSFSASSREEKLREFDRNFSLGSMRLQDRRTKEDADDDRPPQIAEGEEEQPHKEGDADNPTTEALNQEQEVAATPTEDIPPDLSALSDDIDQFLAIILSLGQSCDDQSPDNQPPEIPEATIEKFAELVEKEISKYESGTEKWSPESEDPSLLEAVDRLSKLVATVSTFSENPKHFNAMNVTGVVLHHAMSFLEDEFFALLDESTRAKQEPSSGSSKTKRPPSFKSSSSSHEPDRCVLPSAAASESNTPESCPPPETVAKLRSIAGAMISAGYGTECCEVFAISRRNAYEASLTELGFEKIAIDDVQRMAWDSLEGEIASWNKAFRHSVTVTFPLERDLCEDVFSGHPRAGDSIFRHLAGGAILQLLNFAEALALTKRSAEKLFKVLDMYETLRDMLPKINNLFPADADAEEGEEHKEANLTSDVSSAKSRLGEAAASIFCEMESSIKSETGKTPVPGGAVHPLTRYVMNYLKYACEYVGTLEQIFKEHKKSEDKSSSSYDDNDDSGDGKDHATRSNNSGDSLSTPFAIQLIEVMDLLQSNLETKSKLYKDPSLSNIFLMNNGRYIVQKIKGSAEINKLLGDTWCRKRSSELRQYHKNYQRETWSRVLACFKDEGLHVKGSVSKPVLKERFKSFNALFEEIHKAQSSWVVSDEQLQSELRVSVSAVVVPAYRSFLGRFQQYLDPGRQTEKYIKFGPEDLENYIDELFDGNPSSMIRRRT